MKKEADRVRRWREKQKAEGKSSFTVVLSRDAREFLAAEKEKTGESYAAIMEKALSSLKRQAYAPPVLRHFPRREEALARAAAAPPAGRVGHDGNRQPRILIDDLANYQPGGHRAGTGGKGAIRHLQPQVRRRVHHPAASLLDRPLQPEKEVVQIKTGRTRPAPS